MDRVLSTGNFEQTLKFLNWNLKYLSYDDANAPWISKTDWSKHFWLKRLEEDLKNYFSDKQMTSEEELATARYFEKIIKIAKKIEKKSEKTAND